MDYSNRSREDHHPHDAVKEKAPPHECPPQNKNRHIKKEIEQRQWEGWKEIVDNQGDTYESATYKVMGYQDPVDCHSNQHAPQADKKQVPEYLFKGSMDEFATPPWDCYTLCT